MSVSGWTTIVGFVVILTAIAYPLGAYMAAVYGGGKTFMDPVLGPVERLFFRLIRVDSKAGQDWKGYAKSLLIFSLVGWLVLYIILRTQAWSEFGLNTGGFHSMPWNVAFSTTSSFLTNTNWQYYGGETTLTYFSQMVGLAVQNFASAAVGIAVAVALIRGIAARSGNSLGNFYVDVIRTIL
jgi:K+-transporting ATPase ATPase A chain